MNHASSNHLIYLNVLSIVLLSVLSSYVLKRRQEHFDGAVFTWRSAHGIMEPTDMLAIGALFLVYVYMLAFFLLPYVTNLHQDDWSRLHLQSYDGNNTPASAPVQRRVVELDENGASMY